MYGMLSEYIPNLSAYIYIYLVPRLTNYNAVYFITLPSELSRSLVNAENWLHNVNIFNSLHIFSNNSFKYLLLSPSHDLLFVIYIYIYIYIYMYSFILINEHKYRYLHPFQFNCFWISCVLVLTVPIAIIKSVFLYNMQIQPSKHAAIGTILPQ